MDFKDDENHQDIGLFREAHFLLCLYVMKWQTISPVTEILS
jgi:hypothetical protein